MPWAPPDNWATVADTEATSPGYTDATAQSGFTPYPPYNHSDPPSPSKPPEVNTQGVADISANNLNRAQPTATLSVPADEWARTVRQAAAAIGQPADADDNAALHEQLQRLQPSKLIQRCRVLGASEAACDACADAEVPREAYMELCMQLSKREGVLIE
jgi:hypothetical protein